MADLSAALSEGRVTDPRTQSLDELRFTERQISDPQRWRNGLLYSRWQLLDLAKLMAVNSRLTALETPSNDTKAAKTNDGISLAIGHLGGTLDHDLPVSWILTAIEARYLPVVEADWVHLTGVEYDDWARYRHDFDPIAVMSALGADVPAIYRMAGDLLVRAKDLDPMGRWSRLVRRAPQAAWTDLSGDALSAFDLRLAAELLLLFYEDLHDAGAVLATASE